VMDFSHSFYDADLTAAVREPTTFDSLKSILSDWRTASVFAGMLLFSFVTGGTMWSLERKSNPQLFPKRGKLATLFDIFLFSITFITRGAKDYHSYNSQAARALAALGTFASALNLTAVTAVLASVLTTTTLQGTVSSPVDLQKMRVAAFEDSVGAQYLIDSRISYSVIDAPTDYDALVMLEELQFDAVISDGPVLQYAMKQGESSNRFGSIIIMPWSLQQQQYGIALPDGSPLREPINRILLDVLTSPAWDAILDSYLKY
jgi:polar amino acid transport system substrate-binding protein